VFELPGLLSFAVAIGQERGGGNRWQERWSVWFGQFGFGGRIAIETLEVDGRRFFRIFDASWIVRTTEGTAGIIALFLESAELAVEAAKEVHHLGESTEVGFEVVGADAFLEECFGKSSRSGLEADFGEIGSVVAAEMIEQVVLVEAVLEDVVLFELPLEVTAGGPVGDVAFGEVEIGFVESSDDIFVRDAVADHAVDHVALEFGKAGDVAGATGLTLSGDGEGLGVDDAGRLVVG
jgi:hypothetical protein